MQSSVSFLGMYPIDDKDIGVWRRCLVWEYPLHVVCHSENLDLICQIGFGQEVLNGILCSYEKSNMLMYFNNER